MTDPQPVIAVAGIAHPLRFFDDLRSAAYQVAATLEFRDHHVYTTRDVEKIRETATRAGTSVVVTTAKDAVRLEDTGLAGLTLVTIPLVTCIEPADAFRDWLLGRVQQARA